jgi:hypothetical protein
LLPSSAIAESPEEASRLDPVLAEIFLAQVRLLNRDHRGLRWHPDVVKRCLELARRSSSSYEVLRRTISLPSRRCLFEYANAIPYEGGIALPFLSKAIEEFRAAIHEKGSHDADRTCVLLFDAMHLKKGIVSRKDGSVSGVALRDDYSAKIAELDPSEARFGEEGSEATELFLVVCRGLGGVELERIMCAFPSGSTKAFEVTRILISLMEILCLAGIWPILMVRLQLQLL